MSEQCTLKNKKIKICFMGLTGYQLLSGKNPQAAVGPDVYQVLLARELLKHNFQVSYINYDEGGPATEIIDDIEVIKVYPVANRLNLIQKAFAIGKAMKKADADIYFQQGGAGHFTPLFCRLIGRPCIVSTGHDAYVDEKLIKQHGILERIKTEIEIRFANTILVLSDFQKDKLKKNFGREGIITRIHMPLPEPGRPAKTRPPVMLWVGSINERKQPELFLELAQAIPQARFQMVGGSTDLDYVKMIRDKAKTIHNLEYVGFVPFDKINKYFRQAAVFVSTSTSEGFPNTFIQAWMNYSPVVSLNIDPDNVIDRYKLGFHSKTFNQLVKDVEILLGDEQLRHEISENCRHYTEENHNIKEVVKKHIEVVKSLVKTG